MNKVKSVPFNIPYLTGKETEYIINAVNSHQISGNGKYTKKCHELLQDKYGFRQCFLTTSCTDALEMCAILLNIKPGDEVIVPSFTFVSTANAFVLRGAKIIFADSEPNHPNIDADKIEELITHNTKAIAAVHYAGVACDMDKIMSLAEKHNIYVVEDAAQAIDSYYKGRPLGGIGHLGTFSFHETKNIISGEGGMLVINDERFVKRAEIIWEKGTNRAAFWRGEVDKYNWIDIGSSFLPSEMIAAFLFAQLENIEGIQKKRKSIWQAYNTQLIDLANKGILKLPELPDYCTNNAHMFYLLCNSEEERNSLLKHLNANGINAVFHYLPLSDSPFFKENNWSIPLPNSIKFSQAIVRLPFYYQLSKSEIEFICQMIIEFYDQ
ncbi:MAG TPA: dTDP-4-amino-4,6-dideoxygalactose transaminase [Flavobacteriales bacterium]|nr:dTDP-4-amino-4,6-dideoxygalactose transaminase [Flavobacteriales bacterium]